MKTKRKLNCYLFSNLIISFLSLNLLVSDNTTITTLNRVHNSEVNKLNKIYEIKEEIVEVEEEPVIDEVTTISVTKKEVQTQKEINYIKPSYNSVTGESLVKYAKHYLGLKYVHAGNSLTTGTDCSGFTKLIYKEFGINLGRTVNSQIYNGSYVSKSDLKPGDLVFYGHSANKATHVGIYMGSGLVIHQSNPSDGVKINSVNMMVYITARRVITANIEKVVEVPKTEEEKKEDNTVESEIKNDKEQDELKKDEIKEESSKIENTTEKKDEIVKPDTKEENKDVVTDKKEEVEKPKEETTEIKGETVTKDQVETKAEVKEESSKVESTTEVQKENTTKEVTSGENNN